MTDLMAGWHHYTGAVHIHTTESDGTKSLNEVVAIGRRAGLDFMMFADHMTLSNRVNGGEGIYGKTLVVIGYEHNDSNDHHHYLLFESPDVYPEKMSAAEYVAAGAEDKALGILAHPDEIRNRMPEFPPYPWTDWTANGYCGIELWNQMSEWMERLTPYNKLVMAFSPRKSMIGPTDRILGKWDELNRERKVVGVASVDAHAFPIKVGPLNVEIFPYKVHFRCLRTHILLPEPMSSDFETARDQLYSALRDCRVFCSNMRWGEADKFGFAVLSGDKRAICGGSVPLCADTRVVVTVPSRATLRIIHNGRQIAEAYTDRLEVSIGVPGLCRVEAWKGGRGWIFSNHIRIGTVTERPGAVS